MQNIRKLKKMSTLFNVENELNKIGIHIPLLELAKNTIYRNQVLQMIDYSNAVAQPDTLNLQDERPPVIFGPNIEERGDTIAPFYITLIFHEHILHKCMLD